jgi:hypothetical protein
VADPTGKRASAVTATDERCPRCGAARESGQEYCVECGLRLPEVTGTVPALRRRWLRRLGWYPGDWVWVSMLTLVVAIAGAAVAIAFGGGSTPSGATTSVAPPPTRAATTTAPLPTAPEPTESTPTTTRATPTTRPTTTAAAPPNGRTPWPAGRNGWTVVLFSYPATGGTAAPDATARRAAQAGLPEVGVLDSGEFSSLHPGYYVVFSGIYSSLGEAETALRTAHATGFASAYTRQITH